MKKAILTAGIVAALVFGSATAASASNFHYCAQVRAVYPGGIANAGVKGNRNQYTHRLMPFAHRPHFSTAMYNRYSFMDNDHDGIACEG